MGLDLLLQQVNKDLKYRRWPDHTVDHPENIKFLPIAVFMTTDIKRELVFYRKHPMLYDHSDVFRSWLSDLGQALLDTIIYTLTDSKGSYLEFPYASSTLQKLKHTQWITLNYAVFKRMGWNCATIFMYFNSILLVKLNAVRRPNNDIHVFWYSTPFQKQQHCYLKRHV